jgi:hypothetical protein
LDYQVSECTPNQDFNGCKACIADGENDESSIIEEAGPIATYETWPNYPVNL